MWLWDKRKLLFPRAKKKKITKREDKENEICIGYYEVLGYIIVNTSVSYTYLCIRKVYYNIHT